MKADRQASIRTAKLSSRLLDFLRKHLACSGLVLDPGLRLMARGTEAEIFAFGLAKAPLGWNGRFVLRLLASENAGYQAALEHAVQNAVAEQGFPAPRVLASSRSGEGLGTPFLIMAKIERPFPMNPLAIGKQVISGVKRLAMGRPLASQQIEQQMEALALLHSLEAGPLEAALKEKGLLSSDSFHSDRLAPMQTCIDAWQLDGYRPLAQWLTESRPDPLARSICHGDPHAGNMIFHRGELAAVIDWSGACFGHPATDVGVLCGHIRCAPMLPFISSRQRTAMQDRLIEYHLNAYERRRALDRSAVEYFEIEFLAWILVSIADRRLQRASGASVARNPLKDHPDTARRVQGCLRSLVHVEIPLPGAVASAHLRQPARVSAPSHED